MRGCPSRTSPGSLSAGFHSWLMTRTPRAGPRSLSRLEKWLAPISSETVTCALLGVPKK